MTLYREKPLGKGLGTFIEDSSKTHIAGKLWNVRDKAAFSVFSSSKCDSAICSSL